MAANTGKPTTPIPTIFANSYCLGPPSLLDPQRIITATLTPQQLIIHGFVLIFNQYNSLADFRS